MHLGKIYSVQTDLAVSTVVDIEVDISKSGLPSFVIVGLPDKAVEESRERVCSALKNSAYTSPKQFKTVVSLSPANIKKQGPHFDLPIALGLLLANQDEELSFESKGKCFVGELALDGSVRPIKGALAYAKAARDSGLSSLYLPSANAAEAALVRGIRVFPVESLNQVVRHLTQESSKQPMRSYCISPQNPTPYDAEHHQAAVDFSDIVDQDHAKRALLIAAAGGHNIALYGPAGTGKTMLAKALSGILPSLTYPQMLESTAIHSYNGVLEGSHLSAPPLRAPHHTSSYVSIIGGGAYPKPGEISLAHNGVLFLDEFPEFDSRVLESLREPLEDHEVHISRARGSVVFPARFTLVAAMNPPSAVYRDPSTISQSAIEKFSRKISGPIMDRIDIWVEVPKIDHTHLLVKSDKAAESPHIQKQVSQARKVQHERYGSDMCNAHIGVREIEQRIHLSKACKDLLDTSAAKLDLSPRVYHKIVKLAQTIADLEHRSSIAEADLLEALQYRPRDII